jgi:hypothetical protein
MIAPTIWTRSKLHLFPMLTGITAGYAAALASGEFHSAQLLGQVSPGFVIIPIELPPACHSSSRCCRPF